MIAVVRPWPMSQHRAAAVGLGLAALGLAHRLAFTVTMTGTALLLAGLAILAAVTLVGRWPGGRATEEESNLVFTGLLVLMAVVGALAPFQENALASVLVLLAAVLFVVAEAVPGLRGRRLWIVTPLLLAAHAAFIYQVPFPKQDVFRFLTFAVDGLVHHGANPYQPIPDTVSADVRPYTFTYPPGAFLVVAPFRLILGDIRWAYVAAEGLFVAVVAVMAGRGEEIRPWQQAAILLPLVFPRTNQAYFQYGNHEWVLLALAAAGVAWRRNWILCGLVLGLGLASKQYFIVFPVLFLLPWLQRRALVLAVATAALITLPFLAWDAGRLLRDLTDQLAASPDPNRLTFYAILRGQGVEVGRGGAAILALPGTVAVVVCAWRGRVGLDRALVACGVALAIFTLCADFAAYNYYGYALGFVAWGLAVSGTIEEAPASSSPAPSGSAASTG